MKGKKKAFLMSFLSLLMSVSMLVGTTFAWFTDTASTAVNKIQAGTLDIELQYATAWDAEGNPTTWEDAEGTTLNFRTADNRTDNILWEPGCTYELPAIRILNKGDLALKYKLAITGILGDAELNEAIVWTNGETGELLSLYEGTMIPGQNNNITDPIVIKGHMKEDAGNEYQGKSIDGIAITVAATQYTYENDSVDNEYDINAPFPVVATSLVNATGETVVQAQDNSIKLTAPAGSLPDSVKKLSVVVDEGAAPSNITIEESQAEQTYEVSLKDQNGTKFVANESTLFTVELNVGSNREGLKLYHSGVEMVNDGVTLTESADHYIYNGETGIITMKVNRFSPFTVVYNRINATPVETIADLAPHDHGWALSNQEGGTYKLENDINVDKILFFFKDIVIDLNGYNLTTTASYWNNYGGTSPEITIKNGNVVVTGNNTYLFNVSSDEVVINLEKVTIDATRAAAAFRTEPDSVSNKLTINADEETVINGVFLSAYTKGTAAETNIVVNGVHVLSGNDNAVQLYASGSNSVVNAEFNNCVIECSNGNPVYCSASSTGSVSLVMNGCTMKAQSGGIGNAIFGYNNPGVTVTLNNCLDKDGNAFIIE